MEEWEELLNINPSYCYISGSRSILFYILLEGRRATINANSFGKCDEKIKKNQHQNKLPSLFLIPVL